MFRDIMTCRSNKLLQDIFRCFLCYNLTLIHIKCIWTKKKNRLFYLECSQQLHSWNSFRDPQLNLTSCKICFTSRKCVYLYKIIIFFNQPKYKLCITCILNVIEFIMKHKWIFFCAINHQLVFQMNYLISEDIFFLLPSQNCLSIILV